MSNVLFIAASIMIGLHGLVHVMGFYVYAKLGEIEGLPYKTNVLGGRIKLKETGMAIFGIIWLLVGVGFVVGAFAMGTNHEWANALLRWSAIASLLITGLDFSVAYMGIVVNILILIGLYFV